jgi:hypothetical protein
METSPKLDLLSDSDGEELRMEGLGIEQEQGNRKEVPALDFSLSLEKIRQIYQKYKRLT